MNDDASAKRPTKFELLLDFLTSRLLSIVLLGILAGIVVIYADISLSVPRRLKLAGFAFLALAPGGYFVGNYIVSILWDPNHIFLVDLDARVVDGALYRFPFHDFKDLTVVDEDGTQHNGYDITELTPNLYVGRSVDLDAMTVVGTWRGTLDDRDLLRALSKIAECRGQLQDDAIRGFRIELSAFTVVRSAARETILDVVEAFQAGTLPDGGESLTNAIDSALDEYNIDDSLGDQLDADLDLDPERAEQRLDELVDDAADSEPEVPDGG